MKKYQITKHCLQATSNILIKKIVTEEFFIDEKPIDEIPPLFFFLKKSHSFLCKSSMMQYYTKIEIQPIHNVVQISKYHLFNRNSHP